MAEVHSTAAEGAVTRVNKWGESMPILRKTSVPSMRYVEHEGKEIGMLQDLGPPSEYSNWPGRKRWASHHPPSEAKPRGHIELHNTKYEAVEFLFGPPGNAPGYDEDEAKHRRDMKVGQRAGLTPEEST
jgi:hypothetical protein